VAGSKAYAAVRTAYQAIKVTGKGIDLNEVIDDQKQQFQWSHRPSTAKAE